MILMRQPMVGGSHDDFLALLAAAAGASLRAHLDLGDRLPTTSADTPHGDRRGRRSDPEA
jgi:hypothetical protein